MSLLYRILPRPIERHHPWPFFSISSAEPFFIWPLLMFFKNFVFALRLPAVAFSLPKLLSWKNWIRQACGRWRVRSSTFFPTSLLLFLLSSFLPILPFFRCFWDLSGAYCGGRQGAILRPTTRSSPTRTILQLRLKIAMFFDTVFLQFWVDLGSQDGSKIRRNPSKADFKIALDFQLVFDTTF